MRTGALLALALLCLPVGSSSGSDEDPFQGLWIVQQEREESHPLAAQVVGRDAVPPLPRDGSCSTDQPLSRHDGSVAFRLSLRVDDSEPSWFLVRVGSRDRAGPCYELELYFTPLEGQHWTFASRGLSADRPDLVISLAEFPEPDDLRYEFLVQLPASGGIRLQATGGPVLVQTTEGTFLEGSVTLERRGPIDDVRIRREPRESSLGLPPAAWRALQDLLANPPANQLAAAPGSPRATLPGAEEALASLQQLALDPASFGHEIIDRIDLEDVQVERWYLRTRPRLDVPALLFRPVTPAEATPAVLLLPAQDEAGQLGALPLQVATALARQGISVLSIDPFGSGERMRSEPHDGAQMLEMTLVGASPAGLVAEEARAALAVLRRRPEVDATRVALVGLSTSALPALYAARNEPDLRAVVAVLGDEIAEFLRHPEQPGFQATAWRSMPRVASPRELVQHVVRDLSRLRTVLLSTSGEDVGPLLPDPPGSVETQVVDATDLVEAIRQIVMTSLSVEYTPARPTPLSASDLEQLRFGEVYLGELWYSWVAAMVQQRLDRRVPSPSEDLATVVQDHLAMDARARPRTLGMQAVLSLPGGARAQRIDFETRRSLDARALVLWRGDAPDARSAIERAAATELVVGDLGLLASLERAAAAERTAEVWIGLDLPGLQPADLGRTEYALHCYLSGTCVLGQLVEDLIDLCQTLLPDADEPTLSVCGIGAAGPACLLLALFEPRIRRTTGIESITELEALLDLKPRPGLRETRDRLLTEGAPGVLMTPSLEGAFHLEDVVLALDDRGVVIEWLQPTDARRQLLSRRDRRAMWPRLQHRRWAR